MQGQPQQLYKTFQAVRSARETIAVEGARQLRQQMSVAIWVDSAATQAVALHTLWEELVSSRQQIVSHFTTASRSYLLVRASSGVTRPALGERYRYALEGLVRGHSQKALALQIGLSDAAITSRLHHAMDYLGLDCRAAIMPLIVAMAGVAEPRDQRAAARISTLAGTVPTKVLSVPRPDVHLPGSLSQAECAVLRLLIEGRSRREMAALRQTSCHTIANQVSAIFCKLGTSSRFSLIRQLWTNESPLLWPTPSHRVLARARGRASVEGGAASAVGGQ